MNMKKILVPISFSQTSRNALVNAHSFAKPYGATLSLLHCYPAQAYNRSYDFGEEDYDLGVRKMLVAFYKECIGGSDYMRYELITARGSISDAVTKISPEYDLLMMSRRTESKLTADGYFSDKLFFISTRARCPVLITSNNRKDFTFRSPLNIWHIERNEEEKRLVQDGLSRLGIDSDSIITKSLKQQRFVSNFWKIITTYTKTHDANLLKVLPQSYDEEHIDLLILVNRMKGMFEIFMKDEAFQIISQLDMPILILQPDHVNK